MHTRNKVLQESNVAFIKVAILTSLFLVPPLRVTQIMMNKSGKFYPDMY